MFGWWGGVGECQICTSTKVAGNLMKCLNLLNIFFHCLADRGIQNMHLNQSCRKFDEMPRSTKFFSSSLFGWWGGGGVKYAPETNVAANLMKCLNPLKKCPPAVWLIGGCQNMHLNQSCRKFYEMPKSTKKHFFTVWPMVGWVWYASTPLTTTSKFDKTFSQVQKVEFRGGDGGYGAPDPTPTTTSSKFDKNIF